MAVKKKAKKATGKRAAPSRPCVSCGKPVHPRSKKCGACGADQPPSKKSSKKAAKRAVKKAVKKTSAKGKRGPARKSASAWDQLVALKTDIEQMEKALVSKRAAFSKLKTKI